MTDGMLVEAVSVPWHLIARMLKEDPGILYNIDPRKLEELVAASYTEAGFDEVILTPQSGDYGRDVIATKRGHLSIRVVDSVKAYKPGHLVKADDVRSLLHVLNTDHKATHGVVTTTSDFAPRIKDDPFIAPYMPNRLELVNGKRLFSHLTNLGNTIHASIVLDTFSYDGSPLDKEYIGRRLAKSLLKIGTGNVYQAIVFSIDNSYIDNGFGWLEERGFADRRSLTDKGRDFAAGL